MLIVDVNALQTVDPGPCRSGSSGWRWGPGWRGCPGGSMTLGQQCAPGDPVAHDPRRRYRTWDQVALGNRAPFSSVPVISAWRLWCIVAMDRTGDLDTWVQKLIIGAWRKPKHWLYTMRWMYSRMSLWGALAGKWTSFTTALTHGSWQKTQRQSSQQRLFSLSIMMKHTSISNPETQIIAWVVDTPMHLLAQRHVRYDFENVVVNAELVYDEIMKKYW